jgi:hypothetical protein
MAFPAISEIHDIADTFCVLSPTHIITMPPPPRLPPTQGPLFILLPLTTNLQYLARSKLLLDAVIRKDTTLYESRWIISEDLNVEHFDASVSPQAEPGDIWTGRGQFLDHSSLVDFVHVSEKPRSGAPEQREQLRGDVFSIGFRESYLYVGWRQ